MVKEQGKTHIIVGEHRWIAYFTGFLGGTTMGITIPLIPTLMAENGISESMIGANSAIFFLCLMTGSLLVDKKLRNWPFKYVMLVGIFLQAAATSVFPLTSHIVIWFLIRMCMGLGLGMTTVTSHTLLHHSSDEKAKGLISGIHMLSVVVGGIFGIVGGPILYSKFPHVPFFTGGGCLVISLVVIQLVLHENLAIPERSTTPVFQKIWYPLLVIFSFGFAEATLNALFPLFLRQQLPVSHMGFVLGSFALGAIVGTIPLTSLADQWGRARVIVLCAILSIIPGLPLILFAKNLQSLMVCAFFAGFLVGPIRAIALGLTVQDLTKSELPAGLALFNVVYSIGSAAGPFLSGIVVEYIGMNYLFGLSFVCLLAVIFSVFGMRQKEDEKKS